MKIKKGFRLREICGENIIIGEGQENIDFSKIISLNESAAYLWQKVEGADFDAEKLAGLLQEQYEVDRQTALADAEKVCREWKEAGIAE